MKKEAEILALRKALDHRGASQLTPSEYSTWETLKWVLDEDEIEGDFLEGLGFREGKKAPCGC
jgi:hypothetical protein